MHSYSSASRGSQAVKHALAASGQASWDAAYGCSKAHLLLGHPRYGTVSGLQGLHLWAHVVRRGVDCILQVLLL